MSWRLDLEAMTTDAFTISWNGMRAYSNPPWSLVGRDLAQAQQQEVELILRALVWKSQPWYPVLLETCVDLPRLLPMVDNLIQPTHPLARSELLPQLAVWSISGKGTSTSSFRRKLQNSCSSHGDKILQSIQVTVPEVG